jgi:hypothetical protein
MKLKPNKMSSSHLIGVFDDETGLVKAVEEIRGKDLQIEEVFTPYPIHEVIHAMGNKSKLQIFAYFYGLFGAIAVLAFPYWTSVITILSLATFSGRAKLWPGKQHKTYDKRATDDKFVIVVSKDETDPGELGTIQGIMKANGAVEIREEEA